MRGRGGGGASEGEWGEGRWIIYQSSYGLNVDDALLAIAPAVHARQSRKNALQWYQISCEDSFKDCNTIALWLKAVKRLRTLNGRIHIASATGLI